LWLTVGAVLVITRQAVMLARTVRTGKQVAQAGRRYGRRRPAGAPRLLVTGDSSAAGTGASSRATTAAGRLGHRYPDASVVNLAHIGSRTRDVADQLQRLSRRVARLRQRRADFMVGRAPYALLVVHTGGNDALHFTPPSRVASQLARALAAGQEIAEAMLVVTGGNFALAPGLPAPLTWAWSWWGRRLRTRFAEVCARYGAVYVDLYREAEHDPTVTDPARYFAADGVHPSDANYRLWFREMDRALRDRGHQVALSDA